MNFDIALLLGQDGITNGAIYALLALALVLAFAVTRVIFIQPDGRLRLRARVGNHRTGKLVAVEAFGARDDPEALGVEVVDRLKRLGALKLLPAPG